MKPVWLLLFLFCIFFMSNSGRTQSPGREQELERSIKSLDELIRTRPGSLHERAKRLQEQSDSLKDPRLMIMSRLALARGYESLKEYEKAYRQIEDAFEIARVSGYTDLDYMLNFRKGFVQISQGENEAAIPFLERASEIAREKGNIKAQIKALSHLGLVHTKMGDFDKAIRVFEHAISQADGLENEVDLMGLYANMSIYFSRKGDSDKSIEYGKMALDQAEKRRDTSWMIICHLNLLSFYALEKNIPEAMSHYRQREDLIAGIEFPEDRKTELNLGVLLVQSEEYSEALRILGICRNYYEKEGNIYRVALVDHWTALAYRGLDQYDLAAQASMDTYQGARESGNRKLEELAAFTLFQTYHWREKDSEAIRWLIRSNEIKDSIYSEEKQKEIAELETRFETSIKEQEIELLKAQRERDKLKRNQLWIGLLASILLGAALVYQQITRRRKEKEIQQEKMRNASLERMALVEKLEQKEKELAMQLLQMEKKNTFLKGLQHQLESLTTDTTDPNKLKKVIGMISREFSSDENWDMFLSTFKEIHHSFIEKIVHEYQLSSSEVRLAVLLKMNLGSREILNLLNISQDGLKKARYRLRKKLGLESDANIQDYILGLS